MENLKKLRREKGLSQQAVADYLGITRQAYSNYENDNRAPDFETLLKLGEFFGVTVETLIRGDEKTAPAPVGTHGISDEDLMFALWGDVETMDAADLEDVRRYAAFLKDRKERK